MSDSSFDSDGFDKRVVSCLAAANVNRVASVVPIYFGRLAGISNTDQFDLKHGVELVWRELSTNVISGALRQSIVARIPGLLDSVAQSSAPGSLAVLAAIHAIGSLIEKGLSSQRRLRLVQSACSAVATEFDALEIQPPGSDSWVGYELGKQAEVVDLLPISARDLSAELVSLIRMRSARDSMAYRAAMKSLAI